MSTSRKTGLHAVQPRFTSRRRQNQRCEPPPACPAEEAWPIDGDEDGIELRDEDGIEPRDEPTLEDDLPGELLENCGAGCTWAKPDFAT